MFFLTDEGRGKFLTEFNIVIDCDFLIRLYKLLRLIRCTRDIDKCCVSWTVIDNSNTSHSIIPSLTNIFA